MTDKKNGSQSTIQEAKETYARLRRNLKEVRQRIERPLCLAEKILFGHLKDPGRQELSPGNEYLLLRPDRVALQDVSGQMVLLQFQLAGRKKVALPTTLHCDHLIEAKEGKIADLNAAIGENAEVFEFLRSAASRYDIGFWRPGSGIIHQILFENYAYPGALLLGTDSHSPNAGGLGMLGMGVGGSEAAEVMAGLPWELKSPRRIGVHLKGHLNGWASGKDVILYLLGKLSTKGGTNSIVEYFGEGASSLSATAKATITNMGAELGATTSIFPFDEAMHAYLSATDRANLAAIANQNVDLLQADAEVLAHPEAYFDELHEIDLSILEPHIVGPHSPDLARPLSKLAHEAKVQGWPLNLSAALIGSCTNSSYEDIGRAAFVAAQAQAAGARMPQPFLISPGSAQILCTIERDGLLAPLESVGSTVLASACGPCIGQWKRNGTKPGTKNSILTSFNRNFRGRNDSNSETFSFIASPEVVLALGLAGRLDFDPSRDLLHTPSGPIQLKAPEAFALPPKGFLRSVEGFEPAAPQTALEIKVRPESERLQILQPFAPWYGKDFLHQRVLMKVSGKCTTDHISPAGPWLRFRGHLEKISENLLVGAKNAFTGEVGKVGGIFPAEAARYLRDAGHGWVIIGDDNYGEGSSREFAAMSPRLLGATAVIARSFARIHETNLKKQGLLACTFTNPDDYERILQGDTLNLIGLEKLAPGVGIALKVEHAKGAPEVIELCHTYSEEQLAWFRAGSALNYVLKQEKALGER